MGPVRQNPIQRTVRTVHLSVLMTAQLSVHNTAQNSSDNLPSYLQLKDMHYQSVTQSVI